MNYCLIVPHYNHVSLFESFVPKLDSLNLPCIVVDDGSDEQNLSKLTQILDNYQNFYLVKHGQNRGKGAAVLSAVHYANILGFTHVLQVDADGQHNIEDVKAMLELSEKHPQAIISGQPYFDDSAPKVRVYGRKVTDFFVALATLSTKIKDSLCGFRIYPVIQVQAIIDQFYIGPRMDFDTEVLVKATWINIDVKFFPTQVIYHENTISHFHYIRDNKMLIYLHIRLLAGALKRLPFILYARLRNK